MAFQTSVTYFCGTDNRFFFLMKAILDPIDFQFMDQKTPEQIHFSPWRSQALSEKKVQYWGSAFLKGTKLHHSGTKVYHLGIKCTI